ncbi:hypothetical protein JTB14_015516 [Gonioctena quinquepunctata]|nr:hypothetical protein JTB14_015516 [Gonioctena quinquepunctata]
MKQVLEDEALTGTLGIAQESDMEEAKATSASTPVPKKKTREVTKALNFSSSSDEKFMSLQSNTANNDDEDVLAYIATTCTPDPNQKRFGLSA